jgi:hypothetical protein
MFLLATFTRASVYKMLPYGLMPDGGQSRNTERTEEKGKQQRGEPRKKRTEEAGKISRHQEIYPPAERKRGENYGLADLRSARIQRGSRALEQPSPRTAHVCDCRGSGAEDQENLGNIKVINSLCYYLCVSGLVIEE